MSQARIYTTKKSRKEWKCGNCGETIPKGSKVLHFSVGFRGREQHRCEKVACFPRRSDLESSLVSGAYAALEDVDLSGAESLEDIQSALGEAADGIEEVASEYEGNEMFEANADLQERVDVLNAAAEELQNWEPSESEPDEDDFDDDDEYEEAMSVFMDTAREEAGDLLDQVELP